jgi:hypothetical protein
MSSYFLVNSGGGQPANPNHNFEHFGYDGAPPGGGTLITPGGSNTKTATPITLGTATADLCGLVVHLGGPSVSNLRTLTDLTIDNGATWFAPNLFAWLTDNGGWRSIFVPLKVPAGSTIKTRGQSTSGAGTYRIAIDGIEANANAAPGFTSMDALNVDLANTRPASPDIPVTDAWAQMVAATSVDYGALMAAVSYNGSTPTAAQYARFQLGVGAVGSETEVSRHPIQIMTSAALVEGAPGPLWEHRVAAGSRISGRVAAANLASGDSLRAIVYGFKP